MPHDLVLVRQLKASPENLYRCWTDAELLKQFFTPRPGVTAEAAIDPVPGGRFYTKMVFDDLGAFPQEGCILVADPGRRLAFTDCLSAGFRPKTGGFFTADITFTAKDGGCEYRVTARHADAETMRKHAEMGFENGWGATSAQLDAVALSLG